MYSAQGDDQACAGALQFADPREDPTAMEHGQMRPANDSLAGQRVRSPPQHGHPGWADPAPLLMLCLFTDGSCRRG